MKTSIFDMTFTLPPVVEMTEVEKDMDIYSGYPAATPCRHTPGIYC